MLKRVLSLAIMVLLASTSYGQEPEMTADEAAYLKQIQDGNNASAEQKKIADAYNAGLKAYKIGYSVSVCGYFYRLSSLDVPEICDTQ